MQIEKQIDQITKQVKILERVPREKRLEIFNRGTRNIYVVGSIFLLIIFWITIFGDTIINMGPLWDADKGLIMNVWGITIKLFFPVLLPCLFIIGIPMEIRNYIIKRIVNKEYPEQQGKDVDA